MKHDVKFWWLQSVTAIFLIPLFCYVLAYLFVDFENIDTVDFISKHIFLLSILFFLTLYHGTLGMQVIIEDYVSCIVLRNMCIAVLYAISVATALALLLIIIAVLI